jgi:hypothetical protein
VASEYMVITDMAAGDALASVQQLLGLSLRPRESKSRCSIWEGELCGVAVTFEESHDLVDDQGIPFSSLPVAISFGRSGAQSDADLRDELCSVLARLTARLLVRGKASKVLVVRDAQQLLEEW